METVGCGGFFDSLRLPGQSEVEYLGMATLRDKNVCGFHITMNDALRMSGIKRIGNVNGNLQQSFQFRRPAHNCVFSTESGTPRKAELYRFGK
jgi:hypothetical protein